MNSTELRHELDALVTPTMTRAERAEYKRLRKQCKAAARAESRAAAIALNNRAARRRRAVEARGERGAA